MNLDFGVPDRYFGYDLSDIWLPVAADADQLLRRELLGLGLCGRSGIGKSTAAATIATAAGADSRWISVPLVLSALKREMGKAERPVTDGLAEVQAARGLIVLDDLGAERATDWALETLFAVVSAAYDAGRPVVFTSCRRPLDLAELGHGMLLRRVASGGRVLWLKTQPTEEAGR